MSPLTHVLCSWMLAQRGETRRDRACITLAGIAPDFDGFGIIPDFFTKESLEPTNMWGAYHHVLGHNLGAALVIMVVVASVAKQRVLTVWLAGVSFHLHLFCDLIGGQGPDGHHWPMNYLAPFADWVWIWSGQWALNAWPNFVLTGCLLVATVCLALYRGFSPLEMVSLRADEAFVMTLRNRFEKKSE